MQSKQGPLKAASCGDFAAGLKIVFGLFSSCLIVRFSKNKPPALQVVGVPYSLDISKKEED